MSVLMFLLNRRKSYSFPSILTLDQRWSLEVLHGLLINCLPFFLFLWEFSGRVWAMSSEPDHRLREEKYCLKESPRLCLRRTTTNTDVREDAFGMVLTI